MFQRLLEDAFGIEPLRPKPRLVKDEERDDG
jgi:hypothetical protein